MFEKDELEQVLQLVRPHAKLQGISESDRDGVYQHFIARFVVFVKTFLFETIIYSVKGIGGGKHAFLVFDLILYSFY